MSSIGPRTEAKELVALALAHHSEAGTAGEGSTADNDDARVGVGIASLADLRPYTSEEDEALSNEIDAAVARANATAKAAEEDAERANALMAYRLWRSRRSPPKLATPGAREGSPVATPAIDDAHELDPSPPQYLLRLGTRTSARNPSWTPTAPTRERPRSAISTPRGTPSAPMRTPAPRTSPMWSTSTRVAKGGWIGKTLSVTDRSESARWTDEERWRARRRRVSDDVEEY